MRFVFQFSITTLIGDIGNYIQQNFHQQGGQVATVLHTNGLLEKKGEHYARMLQDCRNQIESIFVKVFCAINEGIYASSPVFNNVYLTPQKV